MTRIAELNAREMRVLLRYIELGGTRESAADTMAVTGIKGISNFYRTRSRLRSRGFLGPNNEVLWPVIEIRPIPEPFHPIGQGIQGRADIEDVSVVRAAIEQKSWTQQAMDADLNGDQREQVKVLREAFQDILGQELTARSAKILLGLAGGYAEDLIGEFEAIRAKPKKIEYPFSYLKKKLESETAKVLTAQPPTRVVNTDLPDTVLADIGSDLERDDYYLDKPSAHTAEVMEKLAAMGYLDDEEDD